MIPSAGGAHTPSGCQSAAAASASGRIQGIIWEPTQLDDLLRHRPPSISGGRSLEGLRRRRASARTGPWSKTRTSKRERPGLRAFRSWLPISVPLAPGARGAMKPCASWEAAMPTSKRGLERQSYGWSRMSETAKRAAWSWLWLGPSPQAKRADAPRSLLPGYRFPGLSTGCDARLDCPDMAVPVLRAHRSTLEGQQSPPPFKTPRFPLLTAWQAPEEIEDGSRS
jgi:hypothetical protein